LPVVADLLPEIEVDLFTLELAPKKLNQPLQASNQTGRTNTRMAIKLTRMGIEGSLKQCSLG
jgi:hypothetical protein